MADNPVRFGLIGAGHMGARHAICIGRAPEARLVAVWSRTRAHAETVAAGGRAAVCASVEELVRRPDVDAVIVATDTPHHAEAALAAIRAGKHVVVEKPLARRLDDAVLLASEAERAGVLLLTGHVLRFYPVFRTLHEQIVSGTIGAPAVIRMSRETASRFTGWRSDVESGGGVLLELAIHDLDWLLWTIGPAERVYCRAATRGQGSAHEFALVTLRLASGAIAHLEASTLLARGFRTAGEISGDHGMLSYDSDLDLALRTESESAGQTTLDGLPTTYAGPSPYLLQLEHWLRCIRGVEEPLVSPQQACDALAVALAALSSAESGKAVRL